MIERTRRPYVNDLVDSYNARAGRSSSDDYAWYVDFSGNPRFGLTPAGDRRLRAASLQGNSL